MKFMRRVAVRAALASVLVGFGLVTPGSAEPGNDHRAPDLGEYQKLRVHSGHKVAFHAYAEGVQIWRWSGTEWVFVKPDAVLYAGPGADAVVGIHYGGPTWESLSGSYVVAAVLDRATPTADAIPWLLLGAAESGGPGIFDGVSYIQRVNTVGGIAPAEAGEVAGEEARVPYAADYYFYREHR